MEPSIEMKKPLPSYGDLINKAFNDVFVRTDLFALLAAFALASGVVSWLLDNVDLGLPVVVFLAITSLALGLLNVVATMVAIKGLANPQAKVKDLWNESLPQFWSYWWLMIIYTLVILSGFMFLIVPGIILMGYLYLALNTAALENTKGLDALVRSTELIKGNWWAVSLRTSVVILLMFIAILATGLVFGVLAGAVGAIIGLGETAVEMLSIIILEPIIVGASMVIVLSATNQIYQALLGGMTMSDESKTKTRRLYMVLAFLAPVLFIGLAVFLAYVLAEQWYMMNEMMDAINSPADY